MASQTVENPAQLFQTRLDLKVTRTLLCKRLGIDESTLWRWETGASVPNNPTLAAWADELDQLARNARRRKP